MLLIPFLVTLSRFLFCYLKSMDFENKGGFVQIIVFIRTNKNK